MPLWRFLVGYVALLSFAPVAFMPNQARAVFSKGARVGDEAEPRASSLLQALFSKEVAGSRHQALLASLLSVADSLGAILGPLWMGAAASGGDAGGGGGDDDGGDDDRSGPVARVMFVGLVGWAGVLAVLVPAVWYACCPPRGSAPKPPPPSGAPFLAVPAEEEGEDKAAAS